VIRVVIVDDSAFMRKALQIMLESDPEIEVVSLARDGQEGVDQVKKFKPDCVTMDIEMPRMNGLEALDIIMRELPTPVLVVSSITTEGAGVTLEALEKGAMDFIPKTQSYVAIDITKIKQDLINKVRAIVKQRPTEKRAFLDALNRRRQRLEKMEVEPSTADQVRIPERLQGTRHSVVAIGVSTGGPPVVQHILESLPADFPAGIIIAQHMPEAFTKPFADRLNKTSPLEVKEAEAGDRITKGSALIGRGGSHVVVERRGGQMVVDLTDKPDNLLYFPSADVLFSSVAGAYGSQSLGVILTGMGHDGVEGLKELDASGGTIVAQNEESCVVYGMPKAAVDAGITDVITSAADIPRVIQKLVH
jgi:two-component system chemotaxis response regulator CheB